MRKCVIWMLAAMLVATAVAACGSSSSAAHGSNSAATSTTATGTGRFAALRGCLKQQGITLPNFRFRGPGAGGAPAGGPGAGARQRFGLGAFASSKLAKALATCAKKLGLPAGFGSARGFGRRLSFSARSLASFEGCVKRHGVTLTRSHSGRGLFSRAALSNPKFRTAFAACRAELQPTTTGTVTTG